MMHAAVTVVPHEGDFALQSDKESHLMWHVKNTFVEVKQHHGGCLRRIASDSCMYMRPGANESVAVRTSGPLGSCHALGSKAPSCISTTCEDSGSDLTSEEEADDMLAPSALTQPSTDGTFERCSSLGSDQAMTPQFAFSTPALDAQQQLLSFLASQIARLELENRELKHSAKRSHMLPPKITPSPKQTQDEQHRTSVMIRNLPNNYNRKLFLELIDSLGFAGKYDFFYLPIDPKTCVNRGYAFVNMINADSAGRLWKSFDGFYDWVLPSRKASGVSWCTRQGLHANVSYYASHRQMEALPEEFKPVMVVAGSLTPFPDFKNEQ